MLLGGQTERVSLPLTPGWIWILRSFSAAAHHSLMSQQTPHRLPPMLLGLEWLSPHRCRSKLMLPISWNGERFGITLLGECFTRQMRTCFFSSLPHSCDRWWCWGFALVSLSSILHASDHWSWLGIAAGGVKCALNVCSLLWSSEIFLCSSSTRCSETCARDFHSCIWHKLKFV